MEWTISLNDQSVMQTKEIDDVGADRNLSAEFEALQSATAQQLPEETLGGSLAVPQPAGLTNGRATPHPTSLRKAAFSRRGRRNR